jgi:cytosine permease
VASPESPTTPGEAPSDLPPLVAAALESPPLDLRGWQTSLAPTLIGLFLWVVFFDQIPAETLRLGGVLWPVVGAAVAGLFGYGLLYRVPAIWGMRTGRPLAVIATSTFGARGATWVPGLVLSAVQVVWLAVSTAYSTSLSLRGLELLGLLSPRYAQPLALGNVSLPGGLYLVTSLLWCLAAALVGRYLVRVIAALMNVFPIVPAVMLALTTVLALGSLSGGASLGVEASEAWGHRFLAVVLTVQMVFGFFATAGLASADWGRVARGPSDIRIGGLVGVAFASWTVATLALLSTAGAAIRAGAEAGSATLRYTWAVETLIGGRVAGGMLMAFGLAALAPSCYAAYLFASRMNETFPKVSPTRWTLLAVALAWALVVGRPVERLLDVFTLVGAMVAPVVGAMAADYVRSKGVWPGGRRGVNLAGMAAWVVGTAVGLVPLAGRLLGSRPLVEFQPAAVLGYAAGFVVYLAAAALGAESAPDARPGLQPIDRDAVAREHVVEADLPAQ